jgi:ubiquinone/menaquinone biosynthesis C-methylase UbiE
VFDEVGYYVDLALNRGGNCLDVGCGTGRVLVPIARQGIKITGLDNSNVMIEECRKRLSSEGISASLIEEDMTNFNCENNFDLIIVPGGSFQLLDDRNDALAALKNFQKHLQPEGLFVMSLFTPFYEISHEFLDGVWRLEKDEKIEGSENRALCHSCVDLDRCENLMEVRHRFELINNNGITESSEIKFSRLRWYGKYEIKLLLERAGFQQVRISGDFENDDMRDGHAVMSVSAVLVSL